MRTPDDRMLADHSQFPVTGAYADRVPIDAELGVHEPGWDPVPSDRYRLPAYAGGVDSDDRRDLAEAEDSRKCHLPQHASAVCSGHGVRQPRRTDDGAAASPTGRPRLDYDLVYVIDDSGNVRRVAPNHPLAQAVYQRTRRWGRRTPSPALAGIVSAYYVAALAPGLLEDVEALTPDQQRAFARWCVHRAFERAGLADVDWIREGLVAMDNDQPPPADFESSARMWRRLDEDPRVAKTVVSGGPGSSEHIQQYPPVSAYACLDYEDPLQAAVDAFRYATLTYGMGYQDLIAAAEYDFFAGPDATFA